MPITWDEANILWNNNPYTWDEVELVARLADQVASQGGGGGVFTPVFKSKEEKKKFIKLLCKIEGVEYKETKEVKERQIRITDVALVAKEVLGVDIKVEI